MFVDNNLDSHQKKSVSTKENNVIVVAPPGSGKTTVIINRVYHLINDRNIDPNNIIVITFTKAAALNMKKRYLNISSNRRCPFFGTFHALFYKIISRHIGKINIIESGEAYRLIKAVLVSYLDSVSDEKVKEVLNDISLLKNSGEDIEYFKSKIDKSIFRHCFNVYEEHKSKNNLLDFDDLQLKSKELFIERSELLQGYRNLFKYILVDEFQDCDKLQIELLQMLGYNNSIFAVGDEDQCIYGFRGSRPDCMVDFNRYFEEGKKLFLRKNYRSMKNIVTLSKQLILNNKNRNLKTIESSKEEEGKINFFSLEGEKEQAVNICNTIEALISSGEYDYSDMAVLYRTNMECRSIIDTFLKRNIKFKLLDKQYDFFDHFVCKDLICYLKLSVDSSDKESFIRVINKPFRYISKVSIEKVRKSRIKESCLETLKNIEDIPLFQIKNISNIEKDIERLNKMHLRDAINFIIYDLGYYDYLKSYSEKISMSIDELQEILEEFKEAAEDFNSITSFLIHIEEIREEIKENSKNINGVILSTIHGVKGMEFNNVFIINCNEGVIPHINSMPLGLEEERRLFYVGITRAIDNLNIYSTKKLKGKGREVSRFISECGINIPEELNGEKDCGCDFEVGQFVTHRAFGKGKITNKEARYITILFENDMERKFDGFVLKNSELLIKY